MRGEDRSKMIDKKVKVGENEQSRNVKNSIIIVVIIVRTNNYNDNNDNSDHSDHNGHHYYHQRSVTYQS